MNEQQLTIPTEFLPADYRTIVAEKFNIKPDTVGKIASGKRKNAEVFDYMLSMAEDGKQQEATRLQRLENLNK